MASTADANGPELSLVVPMYNEEESCTLFFERVIAILEGISPRFEIVCVNDGSTDRTLDILVSHHARDHRIKIVDLSRNFGKELALTAGLDNASGQAVIPIDADLQDPPELIVDLVAKWRQGFDMVVAVRRDRSSDTLAKRVTANLFYGLMRRVGETPIPANAGDFRLLDRRVLDALATLPERSRFMKGLFAWVGFKTAYVDYARQPRAAGTSKWRYWKLWNFALEGLFSFTTLPLRIWTYLGILVSLASFAYLATIVGRTLIMGVEAPGYASIISLLLFVNGIVMIGFGLLGEYVGRIFIEVKRRPLYVMRDRIGFEDARRSGPSVPGVIAKDADPAGIRSA
jgi:glycosyltransferase involved in cell wall biosynthesis